MKALKLQVPFSLNTSTVRAFRGQIVGTDRKPTHGAISIGFERLSWVDTTGVTILSNTIEWLQRLDVTSGFDKRDPSRPAIRYLDDCGFFQAHLGQPRRTQAQLRSTTFPVKALTCGECALVRQNPDAPK